MTTTAIPEISLDPAQRTVADSPPGPIMIIGGPGTGKTHTLIGRIIALLRNGVSPHNITYLTFNSRGADEVRQKLDKLKTTSDASRHIFTGTFHHYASNFLRIAGAALMDISPQYTIWDRTQSAETILSIIDTNPDQFKVGRMEIGRLLQWNALYQAQTNEEAPPPDSAVWIELLRLYSVEKRRQNTLDLDDLIPCAIKAFELNADVRSSWARTRTRHLLIDEFQDITSSQYRLLQLMTGPNRSITIATDPNQNIYSWRGSDAELLGQFRLAYRDTQVHVLRINHRSTQTITEAAASMTNHPDMDGLQDAFQNPIRAQGPSPTLLDFSAQPHRMDEFVIDQVKAFHQQGLPYEDMAFVYRLHATPNRMLTPLRAAGIPYTVLGQPRRNAEDTTRHITALLGCLLNPRDSSSFVNAAAPPRTPGTRLPPKVNQNINAIAREQDIDLIQAAAIHMTSFRPGSDVQQTLSYVTSAWEHLNGVLQEPDIEMPDLCRRAQTLFYNAQRQFSIPPQDPDFAKLLFLAETTPYPTDSTPVQRLARFIEALTSSQDPDHRASDNDDPDAHNLGLTMATIHAAKGLQWHTVWFMDASDHIIPAQVTPDRAKRYHEEQRLFYTASTRATDRLYYCSASGSKQGFEAEPTRFLESISEHLVRRPM